ncbi:LysR family transcriptional regulator [Roseibium sp. M-1]
MQLFVRVVERGSFTAAAADLNLPRSTATDVIQRLERDLGCRLLDRTTRHVSPTPDGEAYYRRCVAILADVEEAEGALRGHEPSGHLRVDVPGRLTRTFLLPHLPGFMARFPKIDLQLGQGERLVDLVREGVDCVIRAGVPDDSGMIMRKLTEIPEVTCASPEYLAAYGVPGRLEDLPGHQMVGFLSSRTGSAMPLDFQTREGVREVFLPNRIVANDAETVHHLARLGFGLIQAPRYRLADDLQSGALVQLLPDFPPTSLPLAAFYPQNRQLSPRVRVFVEWAAAVFSAAEI